jgi:hypothetical protein
MDCSADPPVRGCLRPAQGFARSMGSESKRSCRPALPRNLLPVAREPTDPLADARWTWKPRGPTLRCRPAGPTTCVCLSCTLLQARRPTRAPPPWQGHGPRHSSCLAMSTTCDAARARRRRRGSARGLWAGCRRRRDAACAVVRDGRGRLSRIEHRCGSSGRTAPCCFGREGTALASLCTGRRQNA